MAPAIASAPAVDLKVQASFSVKLGNSIMKPQESSRYTSIRYNHKPSTTGKDSTEATLTPGEGQEDSKLSLKDGEDEWTYSGKHNADTKAYVLIVREKDKSAVLERLNQAHVLNLASTPGETDAAVLAKQYPQLSIEDEGNAGEEYGNAETEDSAPDPSNPFDFRHFLKAAAAKLKTQKDETTKSTVSTPLIPARVSGTPISRPPKRTETTTATTKRKAPVSGRASSKRVKAGEEPAPAASKPVAPERKVQVPSVRLDRKASVRKSSLPANNDEIIIDDDSGELILENDEKPRKPQHSAMSLALSGQLGQGPISLRSAASSPGSRINSPMPGGARDNGEEFEIGASPEEDLGNREAEEEEEEGEEGEEEDGDIEEFELPSPVQGQRASISAAAVTAADDDDDLDKQLALAMAEDDESQSEGNGEPESEESEEE